MWVLAPLKPNPALVSGYPMLLSIANELAVPETERGSRTRAQDLISVPDAWAQVEVFRAALTDDNHPLHARAIGEWRGLLAIFALRRYHGREVTTERVRLDNVDYGLIGILNRMPPSTKLTERHNWNEIGLIRLQGRVLGMVVPSTLVCPSRRPPAELAGVVPWVSKERILDPLTVSGVNQDECAVLAEFCREAGEMLSSDPKLLHGEKDGLLGRVVTALNTFQRDADKRADKSGGDRQFQPAQLHLELPGQPFFPLLRQAKVLAGGSTVSEAMLPVRNVLQAAGLKGLLLIDPEMPEAFGAPASEIKLLGDITLQMALNQTDAMRRLRENAAALGYLCVNPGDLFTRDFFRADNVQFGAQPRDFRDALLPVTPAVLMLMRAEDLRNAITLTTTDYEVVVTLRLSLSEEGERPKYYTIKKVYGRDHIISKEAPATLGFWPDFDSTDWHWHLGWYNGAQNQNFGIRSLVSLSGMKSLLDEGGKELPAVVEQAARLIRDPVLLADRVPLVQSRDVVREVYKTSHAPEALYCDWVRDESGGGFVESSGRDPVGILLLPSRTPLVTKTEGCEVGIDFGTVNTCVYWKTDSDSAPREMLFKNRLVLPFPPDDLSKQSYIDFLPIEDIEAPFMTALSDRKVPQLSGSSIPIWASHIYYVTDVDQALGRLESNPPSMNLKWEQGKGELWPVQAFLAQVVLQSLAELVAEGISPDRIKWKFSYPEAYRRQERINFDASAGTAVQMVLQRPNSGRPGTRGGSGQKPAEIGTASESLSTALYFISDKSSEAPPTGDLVTIDMGGLTSDVSIWHAGRLIWRNSLKLAGRPIITDYLNNNPNIVRSIAQGDSQLTTLVDRVFGTAPERRRHAIEMLMNSLAFREAFARNINLVEGQTPERSLSLIPQLALLGILYYIGKTIEYCAAHSDSYKDIKDAYFSVCLGGRASMVYRSLFGNGARRAYLESTFDVFKDAAPGLIAGSKAVFSDRPKHEVAYGLLVERRGAQELATEGYRVAKTILGEAVRVGDKQLPFDATNGDLTIAPEWQGVNLDQLKAFLESVNRHSDIRVELTADTERRILAIVNGQLKDDLARLREIAPNGHENDDRYQTETTEIEPPFIVAVRALIELATHGADIVRIRS